MSDRIVAQGYKTQMVATIREGFLQHGSDESFIMRGHALSLGKCVKSFYLRG